MNGEFYYVQTKDNELKHYGVKGMHWGIRRYQPYTSNPRKGGKTGKFVGKKNKQQQPKDESALLALLPFAPYALGLASLGASAAVAAIKKSKKTKIANQIKSEIDSNTKVDKKTGLKVKTTEMSREEDLKRVNPEKGSKNESGSTNNCVRCTMAYELRRRGYDVQAKKALEGVTGKDFAKECFKGAKTQYPEKYSSERILKDIGTNEEFIQNEFKARTGNNYGHWNAINETLSKQPDSRGQICVNWDRYGGHSFIYEVQNGKVTFSDAQIGKVLSNKEAKFNFTHSTCSNFTRLDNCEINVANIKKAVR